MGKTLLGLHFLATGVSLGEPVLFLSFMESVAQLREKGRAFGIDLTVAEAAGQAPYLVLPGFDLDADIVATHVREEVERRGVQRLVIDSAAELARGVTPQHRALDFMAALVNYLRGRQVTTYLTLDIPTIVGPTLELGETALPVVTENLVLLRNVEYRGQLHRLLSVLKMRFSGHERAIQEYTLIPGQGFQLLGPAPLGEGLLTGGVRAWPESSLADRPNESQAAP
jgi:circadian clock protein KaiC